MQLNVGVLYWIERIAFKMRNEWVAIEIETITLYYHVVALPVFLRTMSIMYRYTNVKVVGITAPLLETASILSFLVSNIHYCIILSSVLKAMCFSNKKLTV